MAMKRASVADQIIDKLLLHIETNHLLPGSRMPTEKEICTLYGVGRSSVREAYKAMQSRELVVSVQGKGVFVGNKINIDMSNGASFDDAKMQIRDYIDVRRAIETSVVKLAIERANAQQIQELQQIHNEFLQSIELQNVWLMAEKDEQFHAMIAKISDNPLMIQVQALVSDYFRNFRVRSFRSIENRNHAVNPHSMIIQAFQSGNVDLGVLIMNQHLNESFEDFMKNIESNSNPSPSDVHSFQ